LAEAHWGFFAGGLRNGWRAAPLGLDAGGAGNRPVVGAAVRRRRQRSRHLARQGAVSEPAAPDKSPPSQLVPLPSPNQLPRPVDHRGQHPGRLRPTALGTPPSAR